MLESTTTVLPLITLDYKKIELVLRATSDRNIIVTPDLLAKVDTVQNLDEVLPKPSTSGQSSPHSVHSAVETVPQQIRRGLKRRNDEVAKAPPQTEDKCAKCGCRMLRVVDPGRPDRRNVLECMRATCLASLKFTDLPLGTVVGKEAPTSKSVYNCLARYYPKSRYTPTSPEREESSEDAERLPKSQRSDEKKIFESSLRGIFVHVPGQETMARLL